MLGTRYDRNIGVWDETFQERLRTVTVGVAGLGGSGGCLASILARNGFGGLNLADPDRFETHNIQRQLFAGESTVGVSKTRATATAVADIDPSIRLELFEDGVTEDNVDRFLAGCDFVHEAIDYSAPAMKILIHRKAREAGIVSTTAAMVGAGVMAIAFEPDGMTFEDYFQYPGSVENWNLDPDRIMRGDPDYLDKPYFLSRVRAGTVPTTADGAFLTGVVVAGLYKRLLMGKTIDFAPSVLRLDLLDDAMYRKTIVP